MICHVEYGNATTMERNGDTIHRYRAIDVSDIESILGREVDPGNVPSFQSAFDVDADGIVRRADYRSTFDRPDGTVTVPTGPSPSRRDRHRPDETVTVEVRIRVLGYGTTTVGEPPWLEEATAS